ncbi:MAG: TatD family hydrolase [Candidatus Helarchaeota archaeon]
MNFIDSHCHLDYRSFKNDVDKVILRAKKENIMAIITSSIDSDLRFVNKLKSKYKNYIFHALGLHPPSYTKDSVKKIIRLINENLNSIVAIGEVGLDYYWVKEDFRREYQKEAFREFIKLAKNLKKPLVIHSRNAELESIEILEQENAKHVLMHCFSGNIELIKRITDNNWLISIPTAIVNRKKYQKIAKTCPLEHVVIETDSPFLSPDKEKNEPSKVIFAAKKIAEIKNTPLSKVAEMTSINAIKFYSLPLKFNK